MPNTARNAARYLITQLPRVKLPLALYDQKQTPPEWIDDYADVTSAMRTVVAEATVGDRVEHMHGAVCLGRYRVVAKGKSIGVCLEAN